MNTSTESDSRATSADFGKTTDDVKVKMPGKVIVRQLEKQINSAYSEERQCSVSISDIPSYTIGVDFTTIDPISNDRKHRHSYETIIFVLEGRGHSLVEDERVEWMAGDAIHIPPWSWHQHFNTDPDKEVKFLSGTNAPLLQSIGDIDCREESE
ncbi:MAG: cupin domain-containing protein [Candidatus Scalindua rubra]|uniref:Cupin domain protein n=1 Tax=Candidatus Scalindua brodae TaxID=237368 RepID=A0A0B0EF97_9BACT|nr:MAG: Cupin domain protein [Candidatus Scalindua brodae]MBZ0108528.1 cupin domain-containing protein [Candidatus Scalindua rubra]TWU36384.1 Cupin domain protein [Candidatus Brocadiaceae bacterium S225]